MDRIEDVLTDACADQRDALKEFHRTGSAEDAARVHYEACLSCERALDALAEMRAGTPVVLPPTVIEGNRPAVVAFYLGGWACIIAVAGFLGYLAVSRLLAGREETVSEVERMERRVRFVRVPGRPDMCIASLPGVGGYGPTFLGAAPCADVRGRVESDEEMAWRLREYAVVRIRGTDICLAHASDGRQDFTLPCGRGD